VTLYSVYARQSDMPLAVADRFSWSAAIVPPVHALVHGLWLMLAIWMVKVVALVALSFWIGGEAAGWLYVVLAAWLGFAAPGFARLKAERRGTPVGDYIAQSEDGALVAYLTGKAAA